MVALTNPRREAFAQAVARGLSKPDAAEAAGYVRTTSYCYARARNAAVAARVEEIAETFEWGATSDLAPVINELMRAAKTALGYKTAASVKAAGDLLFKAAELKQRLPPDPAPAPAIPLPVTLSPEEWSRQFPPRG